MKVTSIKIAVMGLILGASLLASPVAKAEAKAEPVDTSKGSRLVLPHGAPLRTVEDFQSLGKGDKISAYCPMMKETYTTTIRDVDSKGRATVTETKKGFEIGGCDIVLQKKADSKEVTTLMRCPNGKILPVECTKM